MRRSHLESSALAEDARRIILHHLSLVDMLSIHCVSPAWRRRGLLCQQPLYRSTW